jgi:hypothetical protein
MQEKAIGVFADGGAWVNENLAQAEEKLFPFVLFCFFTLKAN